MKRIKFTSDATQKSRNIHYIRQYREIPTDSAVLNAIIDAQADTAYNEYEKEIKQDIVDRIMFACETILTEHQLTVLKMWIDGKTQAQIADELGIQQTSINKAIHGIYTVKDGKRIQSGGLLKKIRLWAEKDEVLQQMLETLKGGS